MGFINVDPVSPKRSRGIEGDHAKKLKPEQDAFAQLLDDLATFIERAKENDVVTDKKRSKHFVAEKKMTEDATTIKSLKAQLREASSHVEDIGH